MPHQCGTEFNGKAISADMRPHELGNLLRAGGYECIYGGKWHVPEIAMPEVNDHGFRTIAGFDDTLLAPACRQYFREYSAKPAGSREPFFLAVNFDNPHNICEFARRMALPWVDLGEPPPTEQMPSLPPNFEPPDLEPEIVRIEQASHFLIYPTRGYTEADWRRLRWGYFRLTEWVDRQIGRVLSSLKESGLEQDTVVIFTSDHGDAHGAHRWNQKSVLYEEVIRVPMIVRVPGGNGGVAVPHLVSTALDVLPTVCDYAGINLPRHLQGRSLRPLVEHRAQAEWRSEVFVETIFDGGRGYNTAGRAVVTDRYKYIVYDRGRDPEQVFDLAADPGEMHNLLTETAGETLRDRFRRRLQDWQAETGDRFPVPGYRDGARAGGPRT